MGVAGPKECARVKDLPGPRQLRTTRRQDQAATQIKRAHGGKGGRAPEGLQRNRSRQTGGRGQGPQIFEGSVVAFYDMGGEGRLSETRPSSSFGVVASRSSSSLEGPVV